ncbi:MAG: hypothetical protein LLG01_12995 [Planctomycetaceae bacterium]|nr:hypothetical protein [Planctomycetaceae bacterium]
MTMNSGAQLDALVELAESLDIAVRCIAGRPGDGASAGDLVCLKGKLVLFLDSTAPPAEQAAALAGALAGRKELQDRFLTPALREALDRAAAAKCTAGPE